jgi:hypothetical protein
MPLGVLGVEQQPEHGRGQLETADAPRHQQRGLWRTAELREDAIDLPLEIQHQLGGLWGLRSGLGLRREKGPLLLPEPLTPSIREEPVQTARGMADVEAHRGRPARMGPQVIGR